MNGRYVAEMTREVTELFAVALANSTRDDADDERRWDAVTELRRLGTDEVLGRAVALIRSMSPVEREGGVDVLAQIAFAHEEERKQAIRDSAVAVLVDLADSEDDRDVRIAGGEALGAIYKQAAEPVLLRFAADPDPEFRYLAASGLCSTVGEEPAPEAVVEALLVLMRDPDVDVRDWSTFSLGTQLEEEDTPRVREALIERLEDPDTEVRGEAVRGLALRRDPRALEATRRELEGDPAWMVLHAAEMLGDDGLLPAAASAPRAPPGRG